MWMARNNLQVSRYLELHYGQPEVRSYVQPESWDWAPVSLGLKGTLVNWFFLYPTAADGVLGGNTPPR